MRISILSTSPAQRAALPVETIYNHALTLYEGGDLPGALELLGAVDDAGANDPASLAPIRHRLEASRARSPIFNPERMARHIQSAFELMAERARLGLAPDHIDVPALP